MRIIIDHEREMLFLGEAERDAYLAHEAEAESLAVYNDLIARGYSDGEARGTAWPEEADA